MNSLLRKIWISLSVLIIFSCTEKSPKADIIIINGNIWTGDESHPAAEALAISSDTLMAVGTNEEIEKYTSDSTRIIDAKHQFIVPGFIDSHVHFLDGGLRLSSVQLRDAKTPEEFITRIRDFAQTMEPGTWITGGDWDHENWGGKLPEKSWIDSVTMNNPILINRLDGHMVLANSVALKAAGIDKSVHDIEGGTIVRNAKGEITGIFKDNAMSLFSNAVPEPNDQMKTRALRTAMDYVASKGVTSVQDMGGDLKGSEDVYKQAEENNELITRIYFAYPLSKWKELEYGIQKNGRGDKWLKIGGLKGFMDGSLGSHTAAFFDPFTDSPLDSGFLVNSLDDMYTWISSADKANLQVMVHAIGDRAINSLLNIYERVIKENGEKDRRFRIEHAQHIMPDDIGRFNELHIIASMQPYHAIDDGRWAEKVIGPERIRTTYAFKSLLDAGIILAFGSDWFVAPPTPLDGIYAAVTRRTLDGNNPQGWVPEQKITVEQALRAYTLDAAFAAFDEKVKGSLIPGKLADLVIINEDLRKIVPENIRDAKIMLTMVGGKIVYQND